MTARGGAEELLNDIRGSAAAGQADHAALRLMDLARDYAPGWVNDAIVISYRLTDNENQARAIGETEQSRARRAEIVRDLLDLAEKLGSEARPGSAPGSTAAATAAAAAGPPPAPRPMAVRLTRVSKQRKNANPAFTLSDVSLELRLGEILAVIGPNGHGKSTLLDIMSGTLAHDSGELEYPALCGSELYWPLVKRHLSYVPQRAGFSGDRDIERFLRFTAALYGARDEKSNDEAVDFILYRLGLSSYRHTTFGRLSGGYQARFTLAAALLKKPKLLILDEPLAHLDKNVQLRFLRDLRELSGSEPHGFACVVSSQHLHEIEAISDYTLFLSDGRAAYYGPTASIGAQALTEICEIQCEASLEELKRLLAPVGAQVERSGPYSTIVVSRQVGLAAVLGRITAQHKVAYFRNIGHSSRIFFPGD